MFDLYICTSCCSRVLKHHAKLTKNSPAALSWVGNLKQRVPITIKSSNFKGEALFRVFLLSFTVISIFRYYFRCDNFSPKKIITIFFLYRAITCIYSQINGVACSAKKKIEGAFSRVSKPLEELKKASKKVTVSTWVVWHFHPGLLNIIIHG